MNKPLTPGHRDRTKKPRTIEVCEIHHAGFQTRGRFNTALLHVEAASGTEYVLEFLDVDEAIKHLLAIKKAMASREGVMPAPQSTAAA